MESDDRAAVVAHVDAALAALERVQRHWIGPVTADDVKLARVELFAALGLLEDRCGACGQLHAADDCDLDPDAGAYCCAVLGCDQDAVIAHPYRCVEHRHVPDAIRLVQP